MTQNNEVMDGSEELHVEEPDPVTEEQLEQEETAETAAAETEIAESDGESGSEKSEIDEIGQLRDELDAARAKADENWDRVLRIQAEMDNTRKRLTQEVENARKYGQQSMVEELLPICDSMEMGIQAANEENAEIDKIREGYDLTAKLLSKMLGKFNVDVIDPIDEKFDPDKHQAVSMQEGTGKEANTVVFVMQKGYTLNNRLIRPALVMVAK